MALPVGPQRPLTYWELGQNPTELRISSICVSVPSSGKALQARFFRQDVPMVKECVFVLICVCCQSAARECIFFVMAIGDAKIGGNEVKRRSKSKCSTYNKGEREQRRGLQDKARVSTITI